MDDLDRYVAWQDGCVGETAGNEEFIGRGDSYIARRCAVDKLSVANRRETSRIERDDAVLERETASKPVRK